MLSKTLHKNANILGFFLHILEPCIWKWGTWSPCSKSCGGGKKEREKIITTEAKNGGSCLIEPSIDPGNCSTFDCPGKSNEKKII